MAIGWNVLVVDDEDDVHMVTGLALKRRQWNSKPINLVGARSAEEAKQLVSSSDTPFHVALVDVVMESADAGLKLCQYLRANCPPSLRIVLRTGQPGSAPKEVVLNEYDIDYYLSKPEVTAEKLYAVIRACLRSSQDIATLIAFSKQLRSFTEALQSVTALPDLLLFMGEGLKFLESKYSCTVRFAYDLDLQATDMATGEKLPHVADLDVVAAAEKLHEKLGENIKDGQLHPGAEFGLAGGFSLVPFRAKHDKRAKDEDPPLRGALCLKFDEGFGGAKNVQGFSEDARFFLENWIIAYQTLRLQQRLLNERMLREKMYVERVESIAHMVTGIAHEINTPLGVANTANSLIKTMVNQIAEALPESHASGADDLLEACHLLERNIARAHTLIRSFKQLSASQLSDQRGTTSLPEVANDCVASLSPELKKHQVVVNINAQEGDDLGWEGYAGHLSQVIINLIQNAVKYAYAGKSSGVIDINLRNLGGEEPKLECRVQDYGAGIDAEVRERIFEPFVTTGGTGLGLAIVDNIVSNLLRGTVTVDSEKGKGTVFIVTLPAVVPDNPQASIYPSPTGGPRGRVSPAAE